MADNADSFPPGNAPGDSALAEQKMRRALGLNTGRGQPQVAQQRPDQIRSRNRFANSGDVPVVMLNQRSDEHAGLRERIAELQGQLEGERGAHAGTRKALHEQQVLVQSLETRLAHGELAHRDALAQMERALAIAQEELGLLRAAGPGRRSAPAVVAAPSPAQALDVDLDGEHGAMMQAEAAPKRRGRPRIHPEREPKPVRWWTPSFKAKTKA